MTLGLGRDKKNGAEDPNRNQTEIPETETLKYRTSSYISISEITKSNQTENRTSNITIYIYIFII